MKEVYLLIYLSIEAIFLHDWEDKSSRTLYLGRWIALVQMLASPLTLSTSKRVGKILNISEPQFPHLQNGNDYISSSVMFWWLNKINWKCLEFFPCSSYWENKCTSILLRNANILVPTLIYFKLCSKVWIWKGESSFAWWLYHQSQIKEEHTYI